MKRLLFLLSICLLPVFGCEEKTEALADQQIELNETFSLQPPQKAQADRLKVQVLQISDSRCPADVQCVWEGEVTVSLNVQLVGKNEEVDLILHKPDSDGKNTAVIGDYRITLEWVSMPPQHNSKWKLEDYNLHLRVSKV
jgi:hypothetical protein